MPISPSQKTILAILSDGQFHSGTELAKALSVSRSAVWKQLSGLSTLGLPFCAVSGKGYRLERPLECFDEKKILEFVAEPIKQFIGSFEIFDCIPSTNSYFVERVQTAASGSVCFAELQTAGKGRRGRQWVSPFGSNIYLSLLWRFQGSPLTISGLSLVVGIAVMRALKIHYQEEFQLKWPNDIFYENKKLGGILIEVLGEAEGPCTAVIGLGLNLYLPEKSAEAITQQWTDLSKITGRKQLNKNGLAATLLGQLLPIIADFEANGLAGYLEEWRSYDALKDKNATLYVGQNSYSGIVNGIDNQGLLLITMPDGRAQAFASGEVSFSGNSS